MITKKEQIMGAETTFARSPLQALRAFFGSVEREKPPIRFFSHEYRNYRKRLIEEGKGTRWRSTSSGAEKEKLAIDRFKMQSKRSRW